MHIEYHIIYENQSFFFVLAICNKALNILSEIHNAVVNYLGNKINLCYDSNLFLNS